MGVAEDINQVIGNLFDNSLIPGLAVSENVNFKRLQNVGPGSYNAATGAPGTQYAAPVAVRAVITQWTQYEIGVSQGRIQNGDLKVILQVTQSFSSIKIGDLIERGSVDYHVLNIDTKDINGANALFICQVRR